MSADDREFRYGWIDAKAAIKHLGLGSTRALRRAITEHKLPFRRIGRSYRFRRADLDEWMDDSVGGRRAIESLRKAS